jgi:hypothetical protein
MMQAMPDQETESEAEPKRMAPSVDYVVVAETVTDDSNEAGILSAPLSKGERLSRGVQQELDLLKALSDEQEARNRRAQNITANLHRQFQLAEAENSRIRSELEEARAELTVAQQGGLHEIQLASTREARVREELVAARSSATSAIENLTRRSKKWQGISAALGTTAVLLAGAVFWQWHAPSGNVRTVESRDQHLADSRPNNKPAAETPQPANASAKIDSHDFTDAMVLLDRALGHFRGNNPEDVIRRIRNENAAKGISVCSFEWNAGEPSLLFGTGERNLGLDAVIAHCADAIEKAAQ